MAGFTDELIQLAQKSEADYGVPASVTLAQYAYESGWGTSGLATKYNNYFGMKYRNGNGNSDPAKWYTDKNGVRWQVYSSIDQSFDDHGRLMSSEKYSALTKGATNVEEYVKSFAETYAPSSDGNNNYAKNVLSIIKQYNLTQYDSGTLGATASTSVDLALGSGSSSGSEITTSTGTPVTVPEKKYNWLDPEYWMGILGDVIKFIVILAIVAFAFILMMKAFNVDVSKKGMMKKLMQKAGAGAEEGETE